MLCHVVCVSAALICAPPVLYASEWPLREGEVLSLVGHGGAVHACPAERHPGGVEVELEGPGEGEVRFLARWSVIAEAEIGLISLSGPRPVRVDQPTQGRSSPAAFSLRASSAASGFPHAEARQAHIWL